MRAVIMAAGMGRRMNNSIEMPKSILPVGETTIIRHTVKMLTDNGISTAVVVGYRKNDIYSALQGLPVTYYFNPFSRSQTAWRPCGLQRNSFQAKMT